MSARDERAAELRGIYIESGISHRTREPFCRVSAQGRSRQARQGTIELVGQLTPAEVRAMALGWLEAAEGAIHDAAVLSLLVDDVGLDLSTAARFVGGLRSKRADAHTMEDPPEEL